MTKKGTRVKKVKKKVKREENNVSKESEEKERKEIEKIMNIKDETEIWRYIRKERRNKVQIDESITVDKWKQHFMNLLEETERSRGEERRIKVEGGDRK